MIRIVYTTDGKFVGEEIDMPIVGDKVDGIEITFVKDITFGSPNYIFQFENIGE